MSGLIIRSGAVNQILTYFKDSRNHLDNDKKHISKEEFKSAIGKISNEADEFLKEIVNSKDGYSTLAGMQTEGIFNDSQVSMRDMYAANRANPIKEIEARDDAKVALLDNVVTVTASDKESGGQIILKETFTGVMTIKYKGTLPNGYVPRRSKIALYVDGSIMYHYDYRNDRNAVYTVGLEALELDGKEHEFKIDAKGFPIGIIDISLPGGSFVVATFNVSNGE